jgi:hypothetical protein
MEIGKYHLQCSKTDFWKLVGHVQFQQNVDEVQVLSNSPVVNCTLKTSMKILTKWCIPKIIASEVFSFIPRSHQQFACKLEKDKSRTLTN